MAGEQLGGLPEPLREWVRARADETGRQPEEVLARAAAAYRLLDEHEELLPEPLASDGAIEAELGQIDDLADRAAALDDRTETLDERVAALEDDLDEKIQDVRERVIQVKRETDEKALEDHDHSDLRSELDAATERATDASETAEEALAEIDAVREEFDDLDESVQAGFDNYEEILRGLKDAADDMRARTNRLASALTDLGDRVAELETKQQLRADVEELQREANEKGVAKGKCESCESKIQIGLLSKARCPHCEAAFEEIDADNGLAFFRPATLVVADRPALESGDDEEDGRSPTDIDLTGQT
jgi:chromosome segregation ATPase